MLPTVGKRRREKDPVSRGPLLREESMGLLSGRLRLKKLAFLQEHDDRFSTAFAE